MAIQLAVINEPHGSQAAEFLMSLLPRSRMIFLLRDGRDVIDSVGVPVPSRAKRPFVTAESLTAVL